ncbi:MAG: 1-acyl-sn-glycerol-3-phosphate acyltransferase [Alkalinema sp. RU_4_3]|nr:1-acyl-sn-glycerol-3-phosphate acyltransferase [Alkalinema sp. RU_4_3]
MTATPPLDLMTSPAIGPIGPNKPDLDLPPDEVVNSRVSPWFTFWAYPLNQRILMPSMFRSIEVVGRENLPATGPVILAPTHRTRWDSLMVPYSAGRSSSGRFLRFMVTANEMRGVQGWLMRNLGCFPVDTNRPGVTSLRYGIELLEQEEMVVIFPEGGNLRGNRAAGLNRLHPGLARLALQAETTTPVLVVPMAIDYSDYDNRRNCDVRVTIGAPIEVEKYRGENAKRSAKNLTEDLAVAMRGLSAATMV